MHLLLAMACTAFLVFQSVSQVVINEVLYDPVGVDTGEEKIELKNLGAGAVDLAGFDLNPDGIGYFTFPALSLPAGACLVVHLRQSGAATSSNLYHPSPTTNMGNSSGSIALFNSTTHSSATLVSFVQWGAADKAWSSAAVTAGRWGSTSQFVPAVDEGHSIEYDGSGFLPSDWFDQSTPTIGMENALPVTWISFRAFASPSGVELEWMTDEEPDNHGFRIERRTISEGIPSSWGEIGFVPAHAVHQNPAAYRFVDSGVQQGRFSYRLCQIDRSGLSALSGTVAVEFKGNIRFTVLTSHPNPFNPSATIEFRSETGGPMRVEVYDIRGSRIAVLFDGAADPGRLYSREFMAGTLSSGTYVVRSVVNGTVRSARMTLVR